MIVTGRQITSVPRAMQHWHTQNATAVVVQDVQMYDRLTCELPFARWIADAGIIKGTRRSRTAARSESSTLPSTHRPPIESSSSSTLCASSMMVHIDDDLDAM